MAWSLIKIMLFLAAVTVFGLTVSHVAEIKTPIRLEVAGNEYTLEPVTVLVLGLCALAVLWFLIFMLGLGRAIVSFLLGNETALSRYFNRDREQKGFDALSDGLLALASGDPKLALAKVARAESLLKRPEITGIITAQAAERTGDSKKAIAAYKSLLKDDRTRFAAISGLLKHRLRDGDTEVALKLAEHAFAINPKHDDMQDTLLRLQSHEADWAGAQKTLTAKLKHRKIPRDVYRRRNAILTFAAGRQKLSDGESSAGEQEVLAANKVSPGLVPAAVLAAGIKAKAGDRRTASSIIRKAWSIQPHPELAAAFASIEPDESPSERRVRFERMIGKGSTHSEARLLKAELYIADADFPAARRMIGDLPEIQPTVRTLAIMAAIERGEGADEAIVRGWLAKAVSASRGPQWICNICSRAHTEWVPLCTNCEAFDTLEWEEATDSTELPGVQSGLLNLVAGTAGLEFKANETGDS
ncbi:MAG: heme biosynthesis protein HemY [Rhodobacteraceae bacterium]|nr:heme biosynthesis protein HemY [Paracoccaceae bacterium]